MPPQAPAAPGLTVNTPASLDTKPKHMWSGRIGRMRYFLGSLFAALLSLLCVFFWVVIWGVLRLSFDVLGEPSVGVFSSIMAFLNAIIPFLLALSIILPQYILHAFLVIRRFHDLGWSGWFYLLLWIPFVNFVFLLFLLFAKGEASENKYGLTPDPKKKFLADIFNR